MIRMILSLFMLDLDERAPGDRPVSIRQRPSGTDQSRAQNTSRIIPINRSVRASPTR